MRCSLIITTFLLIASSLCLAQTGPEQGGNELQINDLRVQRAQLMVTSRLMRRRRTRRRAMR